MRARSTRRTQSLQLFVSYSHENAVWFKRLMPVLKVRANVDAVQPWHDTELKTGDRWDQEIRDALERMDIFLCLVSFQFLASDYIRTVELPKAQQRFNSGDTVVVPIILYPMNLKHDCPFLDQFSPLPEWKKSWREHEQNGGDWNDALYSIGNGLIQAIEKVRSK